MTSVRRTSLLYKTNCGNDHRDDAFATCEVDRLEMQDPTVCPSCGEGVQMIAAEKAAALCFCSRRKIYRWIEDGSLHFIELQNGEALVCGRSLSWKMDDLDSATYKLHD